MNKHELIFEIEKEVHAYYRANEIHPSLIEINWDDWRRFSEVNQYTALFCLQGIIAGVKVVPMKEEKDYTLKP